MLTAVVEQFRSAMLGEGHGAPIFRSGRELVEATMGEPLEVTREKFEAWFKDTYGFNPYPN